MRVAAALFALASIPGAFSQPGIKTFPQLISANINAMTTDQAGNVYVVGFLNSDLLPVTSFVLQPALKTGVCTGRVGTFPCNDAFLVKYDPTSRVVFATYLGGSGDDIASDVKVDAESNVYVTGYCGSPDFPVTQQNFPGSRERGTFVAKFNATGSALVYSVVLPGSFGASYIAVDAAGNAVVAGATTGTLPVTPGAAQSTKPSQDAADADGFVMKINARGAGLVYATYLGGNRTDEIAGVAVDAAGNAYVVGATVSRNFPYTRGALDTLPVGKGNFWDGFAVKLNADGTQFVYAARLTGSCNDKPAAVAVDAQGRAHIAGSTCSRDFPVTANAFQRDIGLISNIAFAAGLDAEGKALLYATYAGGSTASGARSIALASTGDIVIAGWTYDWNFPTTPDAPIRCNPDTTPAPNSRAMQAFVARLDTTGSRLRYASYFKASGSGATALAIGPGTSRTLAAGRFSDSGAAVVEFDESARSTEPVLTCVANGASFLPARISPGQILTLFGSVLGPTAGVSPRAIGGRMPTQVEGTRVLVDGIAAPILFARADQINAVAPFALTARRSVEVVVEVNGRRTAAQTVEVFDAVPAVFQLGVTNRAAVLNQDGSVNTPANPARRGSVVSIFLTGAGALDPVPDDGVLSTLPLPSHKLAIQALFWGFRSEILYAGPAPGLVAGVTQVNARIPSDLRTFGTPVDLTILAGATNSLAQVTVEIAP